MTAMTMGKNGKSIFLGSCGVVVAGIARCRFFSFRVLSPWALVVCSCPCQESDEDEAGLQELLDMLQSSDSDKDAADVGVDADVSAAGVAADAGAAADAAGPALEQPADGAAPGGGGIRVRNYGNRVVMQVEDMGELHYYHNTKQMQAFCKHRTGRHSDNCRRGATTALVRRGSGRPIGMLTAWLRQADSFDTKIEHVHCCLPSLTERQEARAYFQNLEGADVFLAFEKERQPGDPDEPATA